jgi:hypothetical protein
MATRTFPYSRTVSVRRNIGSSVAVDALEMRGTRGRLSVWPGIRFVSLNIMIVLLRLTIDWLLWCLAGCVASKLCCLAIVVCRAKCSYLALYVGEANVQARAIVSRPRSHKLSTSAHIRRLRSTRIGKRVNMRDPATGGFEVKSRGGATV